MELDLALQHDVVAVQADTELHLMIELTAPPAPVDDTRQPLRVALVIDRSGSMAGPKLAAAKRSTHYLVDQLLPEDRFALVAYDDEVTLLRPLVPVDADELHALVESIPSGGTTNLSGGWLKGIEELRRADDGIRRVLLLSDGLANRGITDPARLVPMATTVAGDGISTSTIGFGEGFDEHLMSALADAGRGSGHFAESPDDAPGIFAQEFEDLVSLVAQNVSVEVRPSGDVQVLEVLNTYPSVGLPDGVAVQVGDAFAGQGMRVLVKLHVPAMASLGLATVGEVVVRWIGVGDRVTEHAVTQQLVVNAVSADDAVGATPNPQVVEEVTILAAGRAAEQARDLAEQGDWEGARRRIAEAEASLGAVGDGHPDAALVKESLARMGRTSASMDASTYSAADSKRLHYESRTLRSRKRRPRN